MYNMSTTVGGNKHKASLHWSHGCGSTTIQPPGDVMMSGKFEFILVTGDEEKPEAHRERVMCVIDELTSKLKECVCAQDFWKQQSVINA
jgi:hypothetical protein